MQNSTNSPPDLSVPADSRASGYEGFAVGVLAYGSLIEDVGPEIEPRIQLCIRNVETPFRIEYARASRSRDGAPTLIPVKQGGAQVLAVIHVFDPDVSVEQAKNWVWRRETEHYANERYQPKSNPKPNDVVVGELRNFCGIESVLYTQIGANISPLNGDELAKRAIESAKAPAGKAGKDGISYLINAKKHGIVTPLAAAYEEAILRMTNSQDLGAALEQGRGIGARPAAGDRQSLVKAFCEECVWARSIRTHFAQLFESGEKRNRLLAEVANTFFHDLNLALLEYVLLQQCKLTDPASSGPEKDNLTSNFILGLEWTAETQKLLKQENDELMKFRDKINDARRRLVAHTDLRARLDVVALGSFTKTDEPGFWAALQRFANIAHEEAVSGPFEIDASMPNGDATSMIHCLADAIDYDDLMKTDAGLLRGRAVKRRYDQV